MSEELSSKFSQRTSLMGIKIWSLIGICVGFFLVLILILSICFWVLLKTYESKAKRKPPGGAVRSSSSTEVPNHGHSHGQVGESSIIRGANGNSSGNIRVEKVTPSSDGVLLTITDSSNVDGPPEQVLVHVGISRKSSLGGGGAGGSSSRGGSGRDFHVDSSTTPFSQHRPKSSGEASMGEIMEEQYSDPHLAGWGHWFTFKELQDATDEFSPTNLIGEGGYGLVFKGQLPNNTTIAVKNLLNNVGQAEKDFKVEVETIGRVRHKNLVRLLGYCLEGRHRMLVYEYVNNGNLEQWLHGALGKDSPITWEARMKIAMGTAKALQYLHEALEPKVVHRDVKSSNILVDKHWNPKVSDFGLAKLLESEKSHVTTRVMGTFGYVAPEYASTGLLNEQNDVYSFGVLLVEIITGRYPVDYSRPAAEANLVEWLKEMVRSRRSAEVLDPRIEAKPTARLLKRLLLVALRCLDPASEKRPKMGHVVHMLEAEEFPREERQKSREQGQWSRASENSDGSSQNISKEDSALESVLEGCGENEVR